MLEHILHLHMHVNFFSYWASKEKYPTTNRIGSNSLGRLHKVNDIYCFPKNASTKKKQRRKIQNL